MRAHFLTMALLTLLACRGLGTAHESVSSPLGAAPSPESGHWKRVEHARIPATRFGQAVAWDEARGVLVMFGGDSGIPGVSQIPRQDTWEWDASNGWKSRPTTGTAPVPRSGAAMVYDSARKVFVLFGGCPGDSSDLPGTWEWDPATGIWADKTGSGPGPAGRSQHGMVFDSKTGKVVLFGGGRSRVEEQDSTNLSATFGDTWEYDGTGWVQRTTPTAPSARAAFGFAYSNATHKAYLFGGLSIIDSVAPGTAKQDIWEYDGTAGTWTERSATGGRPSARFGQGMAIDSANGLAVVFGGSDFASGSKNDLWTWNLANGTWQGHEAASASPWPEERRWASLVMGGSPARAFLVAGLIDASGAGPDAGASSAEPRPTRDVWELNPSTTTWVDRSAAKDSPASRSGHAMASDPDTGKVYVFGGVDESGRALDNLWEWNGSKWVECTGTVRPPARIDSGMSYDPVRKSLILFGGIPSWYGPEVFLGDTWEWNIGTRTWTQLFPARSPAGQNMHAMVTDTTRQKIILMYGNDSPHTDASEKLWEWDGATSTWTDRTTSPIPSEDPFGLLYDEGQKKVVLFGRDTFNCTSCGHWEWDADSGSWEHHSTNDVFHMATGFSFTYDSIRRRVVSVVPPMGSTASPMSTYELDSLAPGWYDSATTEGPSDQWGFAMAFDKKRGVVVLSGGWKTEDEFQAVSTDTWEYRVSTWANGSGCTDAFASECASGHCVDGACCESASCEGMCKSCNVAGKAGTCALAPPGAQIAGSCTGDLACDTIGACKAANGKACTSAVECASGFCVDGLCCDNACTGVCAACNLPGKEGTCRSFPAGTDPQNECSRGTSPCQATCDGRGGCIYPSGTDCGVCGTCYLGACQDRLDCPRDAGSSGAGGRGGSGGSQAGSSDGGLAGAGGQGGRDSVAGTGGAGGSSTGGQVRGGTTTTDGTGGIAGSTGSTRTGGVGGSGGSTISGNTSAAVAGAVAGAGGTTMTSAPFRDGGPSPTGGASEGSGKPSDTIGAEPGAQKTKLGDSGCGCRLGATRSSHGASILLLLALAWLTHRSRRWPRPRRCPRKCPYQG